LETQLQIIGIVASALILASTLLKKQHYVLDLVSGLALAILAYIFGRFIQKKWDFKFASQKNTKISD
jgi:membrane-associated phospholipid phosphatase